MIKYNLSNVFHIENDIMLYTPVPLIFETIVSAKLDKLWVVQDSPKRAISSIVFFPNPSCLHQLLMFGNSLLKKSFVNDMTILGTFPFKHKFSDSPSNDTAKTGLFDGACIGQYLGGTDPRNALNRKENPFLTYNQNFVNETSSFKPNTCTYNVSFVGANEGYPQYIKRYICNSQSGWKNVIHNLHIHSKQTYLFSSVFDIPFPDIISQSNLMKECDITMALKSTYKHNTNTFSSAKDLLIVKDRNHVKTDKLTKFLTDLEKSTIRCFIWEDFLQDFISNIVDSLPFSFVIFTNADYTIVSSLDLESHCNVKQLFSTKWVPHSQKSATIPNVHFLHTEQDHIDFYKVVSDQYLYTKKFGVNTSEHNLLKDVSDSCFLVCSKLEDAWSSIYLGVIPLFVYSDEQQKNTYMQYKAYLHQLQLPCVCTRSDVFQEHIDLYNLQAYYQILNTSTNGKPLLCNENLKLSRFIN
jgi:hypothetical protein